MFPENLRFDGLKVRTQKVNEAAQLLFNMGTAFKEIKKGQAGEISDLSQEVIPLGLEPRTPSLKVMCSTN